MDQLNTRLKQITGELKEYIETRINLLVLNVGEQVTGWVGISTQKIIGFTVLGCGLFFAAIALAFYLGDLLEDDALGFLVVSLPLLLIGVIFAFSKPFGIAKSIQRQLMSGVIKSIEEDEEQEALQLSEGQRKKELKQ
ncbi:MAG: hypothetical protein ED557_12910 [Balneola sp.]|nr:MAG: hypothetical protein ED557_12910 [Balneola sp.]